MRELRLRKTLKTLAQLSLPLSSVPFYKYRTRHKVKIEMGYSGAKVDQLSAKSRPTSSKVDRHMAKVGRRMKSEETFVFFFISKWHKNQMYPQASSIYQQSSAPSLALAHRRAPIKATASSTIQSMLKCT